ncbi:MAG: hypothetical protein AMS15_08880 [Planctomycetes bacterium DG_23]|nr:MAG: hypothetical protein AMS15_08880 [Planctomycetes bacterium DG_23]
MRLPETIILGMVIIFLASSLGGCAKKPVQEPSGEREMTPKTIQQVLKEHTDQWMSIPGVVGTAIGKWEGKPCIKIFVVKEPEELSGKIPSQVEGFPVVIEETGEFRALETD